MEVVVIIIIAVVVIAIFSANKKESNSSTSTSIAPSPPIQQKDIKTKMNEQLQELVLIGVKTLTSLEMAKDEKENLMGDIIDSIREDASDQAEEKKLMFKIMRKSYTALQEKFSFDTDFCAELSHCSINFEEGVKDGTLQSYGWIELIEMVEDEKEKISKMDTDNVPEHSFAISFAVKGLQYRDEEDQDAAAALEEGDILELEEEPDNEYDLYAIKVLTTNGEHIGYIEATKAKRISSNIGKLVECRVKKISEYEELFIYGIAYFE